MKRSSYIVAAGLFAALGSATAHADQKSDQAQQNPQKQAQDQAKNAYGDAEKAQADAKSKLESIFELIGEMQKVDTAGIAPMAHAQDLALAMREDAVTETDRHVEFQALAPAVEAGLYLVPRVIE